MVEVVVKTPEQKWENIIWREWRNCEDRTYAQKLFELVADRPVKIPVILVLIILGGLYFGLTGGLLIGNLIANKEVFFIVEEWKLVWDKKFILGGIFGGIFTGFLIWTLTFNLWTWKRFLLCMVPRVEPLVLFIGPSIVGFLYTFFYSPFCKMKIDLGNSLSFNLANPLLGSLFGGIFGVLIGGMIIGMVYGIVGGLGGGLILEIFSLLEFSPFSKISSEQLSGGSVLGVIFVFFFGLVMGVFYIFLVWNNKGENLKWIDYGRILWFWWKKRPTLFEVEKALYKAWSKDWIETLSLLDKNKAEPPSSEVLILNLESPDWQERFLARHTLLYLGGEVVEPLIKKLYNPSPIKNTIIHLLQSIAYETKERLASKVDRLICPKCIVHVGANQVKIKNQTYITFYGCRSCYQSRDFQDFKNIKIIVVLDLNLTKDKILENETLKINWFKFKKLFDFDQIEILQASDEDVERFCIQIGNDEDLLRRKRYKKISCIIGKNCNLTQETINMLKNIFGEVVIENF